MLLLLLLAAIPPAFGLPLAGRPDSRPVYMSRAGHARTRLRCTAADGVTAQRLPPTSPNISAIRRFALPCLGLWLSQPLLSLIDTSTVGLSALPGRSASQLAALGPATTFCDGTTYLFAFLNVATTNLYAAQQGSRDDGKPTPEAERVVQIASRLALGCGLFTMAVQIAAAVPLLSLYVGAETAANPAILGPAVAYVRIRALSNPATMLSGVLSAALLGGRDSMTPLLATAVAAAANVAGDLLCVVLLRLGLSGAAAATTVAQWAGTLALVLVARQKLVPTSGLGLLPGCGRGSGVRTGSQVSSRGFLGFAAPVLTLILGKITCFGFMTFSAARMGEVPLACHQLTLTTFFFLSPFLEVLSQTAQTFLPEYAKPPEGADPAAWRSTSDALAARLLQLAMVVAAFAAAAGAALSLFGTGLLTTDAAVAAGMRTLALPLSVAVLLTGAVTASEGTLLARRKLGALSAVYVASVALLPFMLTSAASASTIWTTFASFQAIRAVAFTGRVWAPRLMRRPPEGRAEPNE
mgnify:CR=1 FL=1